MCLNFICQTTSFLPHFYTLFDTLINCIHTTSFVKIDVMRNLESSRYLLDTIDFGYSNPLSGGNSSDNTWLYYTHTEDALSLSVSTCITPSSPPTNAPSLTRNMDFTA
jgi:hypothetical protein